ncbi:MAG: hypothetical protein ACJ8AW_09475 [Rhodopila sp.]
MRADELNRLLTTERQQLEGELLATGTGTEQGRKIQEQIALIDESLRRLPQMSRLTTTELKTTLEQLGIQVPPPVPSKGEFTLYPTQGALSAQAQSFLTYTTTVIGLYVSVTGATWVVASSDTLGVGSSTICFLLWLHIFLSVGVSVSPDYARSPQNG